MDFNQEYWDLLSDYVLEGINERAKNELLNYLREDFNRFCITFSLIPNKNKKLSVFEIGGNPYYLTLLMKKYSEFKVECSNCFNDEDVSFYRRKQILSSRSGKENVEVDWINLNIEKNWYRKKNGWDIICFCEVFEHLISSPIKALLHINKMLKKNGILIMSTPNVNRLENVAKMIAGANIYDPFSGYGCYGRHNREYNKHELNQLLLLTGFEIEEMFSQNVHKEYANCFFDADKIMPLIKSIPNRELDLGQYIFIKARKAKDVDSVIAPEWLYRSLTNSNISVGKSVGLGIKSFFIKRP